MATEVGLLAAGVESPPVSVNLVAAGLEAGAEGRSRPGIKAEAAGMDRLAAGIDAGCLPARVGVMYLWRILLKFQGLSSHMC